MDSRPESDIKFSWEFSGINDNPESDFSSQDPGTLYGPALDLASNNYQPEIDLSNINLSDLDFSNINLSDFDVSAYDQSGFGVPGFDWSEGSFLNVEPTASIIGGGPFPVLFNSSSGPVPYQGDGTGIGKTEGFGPSMPETSGWEMPSPWRPIYSPDELTLPLNWQWPTLLLTPATSDFEHQLAGGGHHNYGPGITSSFFPSPPASEPSQNTQQSPVERATAKPKKRKRLKRVTETM